MFDSYLGAGNTGVEMPATKLWFSKVINHMNRFKSTHGKHQTDHLYYSPEFLYSGTDQVACMYIFDSYPEQIPVDLEEVVRSTISGYSTKVSFIYKMNPYFTDWNSARTRTVISGWRSADSDASDEDDPYKYHDDYSSLNNKRRHAISLYYMTEAQERGVTSFKLRVMMTITGNRGKQYDDDLRSIEDLMKSLHIKMTRIEDDLPDYAGYFSPCTINDPGKVEKKVGYSVLTDEILARFNSYHQGQTSGKGLICWGLDVASGYPVFLDLKRNPVDAENILVVAETGSGKSFFVKNTLLYLLADDRFILTINDIEGGEYDHVADYIKSNKPLLSSTGIDLSKTIVLDLSEGSGRYYDPVELTVSGDPEIDAGGYATAVMYAKGIFTLMTGTQEGNTGIWVSNIIDDAIGNAYDNHGVTTDPSTWNNSKGMTLRDIYDEIVKLYKADSTLYKENQEYQNARDLVFASISKYFVGVNKSYFQHAITLHDVEDAKVVICSFGLKAKNNISDDNVQLGLSQLYASAMSHMRSIYAKTHKAYNVKVWEEFQRWGALKGSEPIIRTALTGGRKMGDVNIVITNSVGPLLKNDKFGIFESTTSYAISKVNNTNVRVDLAKVFGIARMIPDLDAIAGVSSRDDDGTSNVYTRDKIESGIYKNAFLVKTGEDVTISKVFLPPDIANSPLFYTSSVREDDDSVRQAEPATDLSGIGDDVTGLLEHAERMGL